MQSYGTLRAELDVRRMEHALAVERATRMAQWEVAPRRSALAAALRSLLARLLRRERAVVAADADAGSVARCGAITARQARRCVDCGGSSVRPAHRSWRTAGRCVRRRDAWTRGRQHA